MICSNMIAFGLGRKKQTNWLKFTAEEAGSTIAMTKGASAPSVSLETSSNGKTWVDFIAGTTEITLSNVGDYVYFRAGKSGNSTFASGTSEANCNIFSISGQVSASGDIMSLLDNAKQFITISNPYSFSRMFYNCKSLTQAPALPATELAIGCYYAMFQGCTALTKAPELPATTLAERAYMYMFYNCTSLTQAPALPATTLTERSYMYMFSGCTSLTTAPQLPATTLANYCYRYMFQGCTSLNSINVSFTKWNPSNATTGWLSNVAPTGTFICCSELPETYGANNIPDGWTIETNYQGLKFTAEKTNSTIKIKANNSAPSISLETSRDGRTWNDFIVGATTITLANIGDKVYFRAKPDGNIRISLAGGENYFVMTGKISASGDIMSLLDQTCSIKTISLVHCFSRLFYNCTSLTTAPELPATVLAEHCYYNMFYNCTSLTQAPELPATTLAGNCYSYMFQNCTALTQAPALPATVLAIYCYLGMFKGCTSLTQAPELPATTLANNCYWEMFSGCTSLTIAPELPATTLAGNCYYRIFYNCTSLNNVNVSFTTWSPSNPYNATNGWLYNVASTGTFICSYELPEERGTSKIPEGWTIQRK